MTVVLIIVGVILLLGLSFVLIRNSIIGSRNKVDEAWSGIDVQLKRRHWSRTWSRRSRATHSTSARRSRR